MSQPLDDSCERPFLAGDMLRFDSNNKVNLFGSQCDGCEGKFFPTIEICPECNGEDISEIKLSKTGILYTWSVVYVAPKNWSLPYVAGYVDLPEGIRIFSHIVDVEPSELEIDMSVTLTKAILGHDDNGPIESYAFTRTGASGCRYA